MSKSSRAERNCQLCCEPVTFFNIQPSLRWENWICKPLTRPVCFVCYVGLAIATLLLAQGLAGRMLIKVGGEMCPIKKTVLNVSFWMKIWGFLH